MIGFGTNKGLIPRVCEELFQAIEKQKENLEPQVCLSYSRFPSPGNFTCSSPFSFFFFKIYLFIICKYTVAVFRHSRRGRQISLQVVVSHHVVAGI